MAIIFIRFYEYYYSSSPLPCLSEDAYHAPSQRGDQSALRYKSESLLYPHGQAWFVKHANQPRDLTYVLQNYGAIYEG